MKHTRDLRLLVPASSLFFSFAGFAATTDEGRRLLVERSAELRSGTELVLTAAAASLGIGYVLSAVPALVISWIAHRWRALAESLQSCLQPEGAHGIDIASSSGRAALLGLVDSLTHDEQSFASSARAFCERRQTILFSNFSAGLALWLGALAARLCFGASRGPCPCWPELALAALLGVLGMHAGYALLESWNVLLIHLSRRPRRLCASRPSTGPSSDRWLVLTWLAALALAGVLAYGPRAAWLPLLLVAATATAWSGFWITRLFQRRVQFED